MVTFGTSGLDRAAELRAKPDALAAALDKGAGVLPLWRGKPMVTDPAAAEIALAFRPADHPVFSKKSDAPIFLGRDEAGDLIFAQDISAWEPEELDEEAASAFLDPTVQVHPSETDTGAQFLELRGIMTRLSRRDAEIAATGKAVANWHASHKFCANCGTKSESSQAGWQRDCPKCGRHHFPRTDPVVIMLITHGDSVLVGRSPGWPEGMYSLLAGFVEPGETLEAAVRREVFEEAGVRVGRVGYLSSQPWPFPASLMFGCWGHAETKDIKIDPTEIEDARWLSKSQMLDVFAGRNPEINPARKGAIAHFLLHHWLSDQLD